MCSSLEGLGGGQPCRLFSETRGASQNFPRGEAQQGAVRAGWLTLGSALCLLRHSPFPREMKGWGGLAASLWPLSLLGPRQARRMGLGGWPG